MKKFHTSVGDVSVGEIILVLAFLAVVLAIGYCSCLLVHYLAAM